MERDPREYVSRRTGIPLEELEIFFEKDERAWNCSGPKWSWYSEYHPSRAVVRHKKSGRMFFVYVEWIDRAADAGRIRVIELSKEEAKWIEEHGELPLWMR